MDEHIKTFPEDVQVILENIRKTIRKTVPDAIEAISYQMPTFKLNGNLVWFATFKNHIGFYPIPSGSEELKTKLKPYIQGQGTLQFPLDEAIPYDLIARIVDAQVTQNLAKKNTNYIKEKKP